MRKNAMESLVLLLRGFMLVFRASPYLTPIVVGLSLIGALEPVASLWIMKLMVDRLVKLASAGSFLGLSVLFRSAEFVGLASLMALQLAVWIGGRAIGGFRDFFFTSARGKFELYVQSKIMRKCAELDLAFFENSNNLDQLERALRGSSMSAWNLLWMFISLAQSSITLLSYIAVLWTLHWLAPIVVLLTTAPQMVSAAHYSNQRWQTWSNKAGESRLRHYISWIMGDKDCAKEIKLFGLSDYLIERHRYFSQKHFDEELENEKKSEIIEFLVGSLSNLGTISLWTFVIIRAAFASITPGDAMLYLGSIDSARGQLVALFSGSGRMYEDILFLSEFFTLMDREPDTIDGALTGMAGPGSPRWGTLEAPLKLEHGIELKNVSFQYPGSEELILNDVSMFIPANKSVAVVGKNGAGKTTLVKLLVRLYDPTVGEILVDGHNIKEYNLHSLRKMFSVVFQDYLTYYLTLRENIGFGDVERVHDSAQIEWAAKQAGADAIAEKLPLKYETYLARHYGVDGSADLSGGEWQKVALARGFMREAPAIILDEPTASLDAFAEAEIYEQLEGLAKDRLSVIISHRFSTVKVAGLIMVLDKGKIVEQGTHDELMAAAGLYSEMYNTQADRYK